ncbi:MAG: prepilin peptidase [Syntrophales bacterium LBB04]|nr:prepilin peptidase [Syntrophales bacterium LBB04]
MIYLEIIIFLLGAAIGSFLNVCIRRIPVGESLVLPASHCPKCNCAIRYYDNIPIISYLLLQGKCRHCREKISLQYPLVELLTAIVALLLFWKFGPNLKLLFSFIFTCSLIVITFVDLEHQIIPDIITLPGIPIFFLMAVFAMGITWLDSVLGLLIGGGILYAIAIGYELIRKAEGMGGGDIKLLAMLGAFFGWQSLFFILFVSSFIGAIVGLTVILTKGKDLKYAVPFGPFLSLAAIAYIFWGNNFIQFLYIGLGG